ncbi:MAG: hypothetical protein JNN17_20175 [Verrucomicrobiaceae bacterium]|nr:hypothetical protein [Verrucomicrobiaceae bacterium]
MRKSLAFITQGTPAANKASDVLTQNESKPCLITLRWPTVEVLEIVEHAAWTK